MSTGLKRFDIFRKMPRDLTEPTFCGALGKSIFQKFDICIKFLSFALSSWSA